MQADDQRLFQMFELMRQRNARHQRHIGGANAAVGQIDRGRRLRGTGHADQHHVGIFEAFDVLPVIMDHRVVQRVDTLEVFSIEDVLRAYPPGRGGAEISLEQMHDRPDDRQARNVDPLALGLQPGNQILLQQREQHDAGRLLDLIEHAIELLLAAHQRIDMFDRRYVGVLRGHRARHRNQRLTGRIGDQMQMKIIA